MMADSEHQQRHCVFRSRSEWYAWPAAEVCEITVRPECVTVPLSHPALVGLSHLRSEFLPVFDFQRLTKPDAEPVDEPQLLLVETVRGPWGFLVDRVLGLAPLETSPNVEIDESRGWNAATLGWASWRNQSVRVLDPRALTEFVERTVLEGWEARADALCYSKVEPVGTARPSSSE